VADFIHRLVEQYGLLAVFLGCLAEGESAATLAGFFAHQRVFSTGVAAALVFAGAFLGDVGFFVAGRAFADSAFVNRARRKPGFGAGMAFVERHPVLSVIVNRYIYGLRIAGAVAAGLSNMSAVTFLIANAVSAMIWTAVFFSLGYYVGQGAETLIGRALHNHVRLTLAVVLGLAITVLVYGASRRYLRREQESGRM
jgi:membrane protein DedA with SNARE-associated domain